MENTTYINPAARNLYTQYKQRATKKAMPFSLTIEEFIHIISQNCHYCGSEPAAVHTHHKNHITFNGVDRVNSHQGYEPGNVVACCWICNRAKGTLSPEQLRAHAEKIVAHMKGTV